MLEFAGKFWNEQMHLKVDTGVGQIESSFELCSNQKNSFSALTKQPAEDILYQAVVHVWQSIFKNYTITDTIGCSNGKEIDTSGVKSSAKILIHNKLNGHYFQIPMQIVNPLNGPFRLVVCGLKGSQGIQFGELISACDKFVWGSLVLCISIVAKVWKILQFPCFNISRTSSVMDLPVGNFCNLWFSLVKYLLEQGDLRAESTAANNQKTRIFLAMYLMMCIVLSNGYKNATVYKMVSPLKSLRYEKMDDLIHGNFSCIPYPNFNHYFVVD